LNPKDGAIHAVLAQVYMRLGDQDAAVRAAQLAEGLEPEPGVPDALRDRELGPLGVSSAFCFARARRLLKRGEYRRAIADLEVVLESQPLDHVAHLWMGSAYVTLGEPDRALPYMLRTLELRDDLAPVHFTVGVLLEQQDRLQEALPHYRRALDLDPRDARFRKALAGAEARLAASRDHVAGL
jgi:tetratricopeptide (TPR) repeat protein